jgi:hypothetical protein
VTNTPQLSNPATADLSVTGANFGEVRAATGERQIRVGAVIRF